MNCKKNVFEIHFILTLDLVNVRIDTKTTEIGALITELPGKYDFYGGHFEIRIFGGKTERKATSWFPRLLNSAYSKNPRCKFSCFQPEVQDMAEKCYISALLLLFCLNKKSCIRFPVLVLFQLYSKLSYYRQIVYENLLSA